MAPASIGREDRIPFAGRARWGLRAQALVGGDDGIGLGLGGAAIERVGVRHRHLARLVHAEVAGDRVVLFDVVGVEAAVPGQAVEALADAERALAQIRGFRGAREGLEHLRRLLAGERVPGVVAEEDDEFGAFGIDLLVAAHGEFRQPAVDGLEVPGIDGAATLEQLVAAGPARAVAHAVVERAHRGVDVAAHPFEVAARLPGQPHGVDEVVLAVVLDRLAGEGHAAVVHGVAGVLVGPVMVDGDAVLVGLAEAPDHPVAALGGRQHLDQLAIGVAEELHALGGVGVVEDPVDVAAVAAPAPGHRPGAVGAVAAQGALEDGEQLGEAAIAIRDRGAGIDLEAQRPHHAAAGIEGLEGVRAQAAADHHARARRSGNARVLAAVGIARHHRRRGGMRGHRELLERGGGPAVGWSCDGDAVLDRRRGGHVGADATMQAEATIRTVTVAGRSRDERGRRRGPGLALRPAQDRRWRSRG